MRGLSSALERRMRRIDPTARIMVEGRIEAAADIRQRYDQFQALDSLPSSAELLTDGGVRLKATNANGPNSSTVTSSATYYRALADSGAANAIDPFSAVFQPLLSKYKVGVLVDWAGSETAELELTQVQAWLAPQYDLTQDKSVAQWQCHLFVVSEELVFDTPQPGLAAPYTVWRLRPLIRGPLTVAANGQAAGFVTFDFTGWSARPRPKQFEFINNLGIRKRYTIAFFTGLDKDGKAARNIGWGYDSGNSSAVSGAGSSMGGRLFQWLPNDGTGTQSPGALIDGGASGTVPACKFILGTVSAATVAFSNGTNDINLGVSTPKAQIELVGRGEVPPGTDLTFAVRDDSSVWQAFRDGQTLDTVAGNFASANYTTLKMRSTLIPNGAGDRGPVLRGLGAVAVTTQDLSDVCEVQSLSYAVDPIDHHAEIPQLVLKAIHDGERDFRDAISAFLSEQALGTLSLRLFVGDTISPLAAVVLPPNVVPDPDNFGAWTVVFATTRTSGQSDPLGGTLAYKMDDTAAFSVDGVYEITPFTGDAEKAFGVYMKQGTSATSLFGIFDITAVQWRHSVKVTWTAGVPTLSHSTGTGTLFPPEDVGGGWWKLTATALGVVAANTNRFYLYVTEDNPGPTGDTYFFRAMAWNASVPPVSGGQLPFTKGDWMPIDDFLIDDYDLAAEAVFITGLSALALIRGTLPKLTDQATAFPASTISNPGAWTEPGGSTNLFAVLADNKGGVGLLPWDDSTYLLSATNPSSAAYTTKLEGISAPATPIVGQVQVQVRAALVTGSTLTLKVELMQGAVVKSTKTFTLTSTNVTPFTLIPTVTELSGISDWTDLRIRITANGTGSIKVTWARLVVLPARLPLSYSLQTPKAVTTDLIANQIGLSGRYRGPDFAGIPGIDTGTALTIGKTISAPIGGSTDLTIAKQELDAVAFIAGMAFFSSQGRVLARQLYEITVNTDGSCSYVPRGAAPVAFFPKEEVQPTSVRPGFAQRTPLFDVNWGYLDPNGDGAGERSYKGVAHGVSEVALASLGEARIMPQQQASEQVALWVQDQGLANGLSVRHVTSFGLGLLVWRFRTTYAHPELELGDVIAVQMDHFLAYDPTATRAIAGDQWATGVVVGIFDVWGRDLALWLPNYASIVSVTSLLATPDNPVPEDPLNLVINGNFQGTRVGPFTRDRLLHWSKTSGFQGTNVIDIDFATTINDLPTLYLEQTNAPAPLLFHQSEEDGVTQHRLDIRHLTALRLSTTGKVTGGAASIARFNASFYDSADALVSTDNGPIWGASDSSFVKKTAFIPVPATAVTVTFDLVVQDGVSAGKAWFTKLTAYPASVSEAFALTDAATIAVDVSRGSGDYYEVTLGGNRTMGAPTNLQKGQRIVFRIVQDGTGGRTLAWAGAYKHSWSDAGNTANKQSTIAFRCYDGTNLVQEGAQFPYV